MTARRTILATATGVVAVMGIPLMRSTAEAEVVGKSIPQVLARRSARLGAGVRVDQTSFPLSHLAVAWSGPGRPAVRVRSVSGWGDWQAAHACGGAKDSMAAGWRCSLLTASGAVGYEVASDADVGELSVTDNGATKTVNIISGHRDWAQTECPGNRFYPQLASLRRDVARLLE